METMTHRFALRVALGLYLLGLGFLGGMAAERMRVDARRDAVLRQYDDMLQRWHTVLMEIEKEPDGRVPLRGNVEGIRSARPEQEERS